MPPPNVGPSSLQPWDVLLVRGSGTISKLIRFFDHAEVSHAALYLDDEKVAEALMGTPGGLQVRELPVSLAGNEWVLAKRHVNSEDKTPVGVRARFYIQQGERYGYEQIVLLAMLGSSRRLKVTPVLGRLLRAVLDSAASVVSNMLKGKRQPMICSEFVYRCYHEALAGNDDALTIHVSVRGEPGNEAAKARPAGRVESGSLLEKARERGADRPRVVELDSTPAVIDVSEVEVLGEQYLAETRSQLEGVAPPDPIEADAALVRFATAVAAAERGQSALESPIQPLAELEATVADFVTPGDLYRSASFSDVGRVTLVNA